MSENVKKTQAKTNGAAKKQDKGFQPFAMPFFDLELLLEAGRKNAEAFFEAGRITFKGYHELLERQAELTRELIAEAEEATRSLFSGKTPELNASAQFEIAQKQVKKQVENWRELAELSVKTQREALAVIAKRFEDGLDEARRLQKAA
ncbi:MAG: phasin family protein [Alphaproteobacteria bacterium]|nr:MAG: phasin family protein [Alphaproteobacteria bacterium]